MSNRVFIRLMGIVLLAVYFSGCAALKVRLGKEDSSSQNESSTPPAQAETPQRDSESEAKRIAKQAKSNAAATAEYHFSLAQAYIAEGNPDRAIEELKL